jgi:hypothetical protein
MNTTLERVKLLKRKYQHMRRLRNFKPLQMAEYLVEIADEEPIMWQMVALLVAKVVGRLPDEWHNRMLMELGDGDIKREYLEICGRRDYGVGK